MAELTVAAGSVRGLMELAVSKGAPRQALAERSGIDLRDLEDQDNRIPLGSYVALMRAGKELCGDPALGLHFGEETELAEMSILAMLGPTSESMIDAFVQFNRYVRLVIEVELETANRFQLASSQAGLWMTDTRLNPNVFPELTESTFARIVCSMRRMAGPSSGAAPVKAVHVTHADPGYRNEYDRIFAAPVVFESDKNALLLDNAVLDYRVPAQPRYVFGVLSERAEALLKTLEESKSARGRVERLLMPIVHKGEVSMEAVAEKLGVSRWTLWRQLKAEGVTFEKVLDELRCKLALHYLSGRKVSVNETAYLVGFSEAAAFSRAFKRWTGSSPREMRAAKGESDAAVPP